MQTTSTASSEGPPTTATVEEVDIQEVQNRLRKIKEEISELSRSLGLTKEPRLVAVSKTKPPALVKACYDAGHLYFGENYVQEFVEKAAKLPADIKWHFIGHIQSNKCKLLASVPNLSVIETVHDLKLAKALDKAFSSSTEPVDVMVQVKTSSEETKSGIAPLEVADLVREIKACCKHLRVIGLMTIGELGGSPLEDFRKLRECRRVVSERLNVNESDLELSMGMSGDFKIAIQEGSTNVRVGSSIFGERVYHT